MNGIQDRPRPPQGGDDWQIDWRQKDWRQKGKERQILMAEVWHHFDTRTTFVKDCGGRELSHISAKVRLNYGAFPLKSWVLDDLKLEAFFNLPCELLRACVTVERWTPCASSFRYVSTIRNAQIVHPLHIWLFCHALVPTKSNILAGHNFALGFFSFLSVSFSRAECLKWSL